MAKKVFERVEKKYILSREQYMNFMTIVSDRLVPDQHSAYFIGNLYYDTDQYDLIRTSLEKPLYKEKLRLRSYGRAEKNSTVFLELKKKFDGVVYKRRAVLAYDQAIAFLAGESIPDAASENRQILNEIAYFIAQTPVSEKVYIGYDRRAFSGKDDQQLRVTFDANIRFRQSSLSLGQGAWGTAIMKPGQMLMEIKVPGAFPLWLSGILSELQIFPSSFSKYGACYQNYIVKNLYHGRGVMTSA